MSIFLRITYFGRRFDTWYYKTMLLQASRSFTSRVGAYFLSSVCFGEGTTFEVMINNCVSKRTCADTKHIRAVLQVENDKVYCFWPHPMQWLPLRIFMSRLYTILSNTCWLHHVQQKQLTQVLEILDKWQVIYLAIATTLARLAFVLRNVPGVRKVGPGSAHFINPTTIVSAVLFV